MTLPRRRGARRALCLSIGSLLLAAQASATWSIVVVNRATREVGVASATCVAGSRLRAATPVLRVGLGVAAAQAAVDNGSNRLRIWDGFIARETPQEILDALALQDPVHQARQYGIVNFDGPPVTFTGSLAGAGVCGLTGEAGELWYAIQGNVITGDEVCAEAERALLDTPGDLGQKLMAAMEAARRRGGDGRCSCPSGPPNSCGAPPPSFDKSAHVGFVLLARPGDPDDTSCPFGFGCALPLGGTDYYLALEHTGGLLDPDPVFVLQDMYDTWRLSKAGVADHVLSEVTKDAQRLVADGATRTTVTLRLSDLAGDPVQDPALGITVTHSAGDPIATLGLPVHQGGNVWTFDATATATPGRAAYLVTVDDGAQVVQLHPPLQLESVPITDMHSTLWDLSASSGGRPRLVIHAGGAHAGAAYHVYGSFSGTVPGTTVGGLALPLNRDRLFELTLANPAHRGLADFVGTLDATGRAEASLLLVPGALAPLVGSRLDFAAVIGSGSGAFATSPAGFDVSR